MDEIKKWRGTWPARCAACNKSLNEVEWFIDGVIGEGLWHGHWGLVGSCCAARYGMKVGVGVGQKYDSKTLLLIKEQKDSKR